MERPHPSRYLQAFRWYRRSRLWVVPSVGAAAALVLAAVTLTVDNVVITNGAPFPFFNGQPDTARTILSLIATSIATLTALVLTVVAVVIQLATQALSPRAVRTFLQDAHSHLTLGTFVTTFTYALVILQQFALTYDDFEANSVTSVSVSVAFVLAVLSLGMFISYVDHILHEARVTSIINRIGDETRQEILQGYRDATEAPAAVHAEVPDRDADDVVLAPHNGVVLEIDVGKLLETAERSDVLVVMVPAVGDFIPTDGRLFEVYGDHRVDRDRLLDTVVIDAERSITQDVPFGFRLLIDIAARSLSPSVNDPTTATQVVDELHDLLRLLGSRSFPTGWHADTGGTPRLCVPQPTWDLYVALAFEEIRHDARDSLQVVRRLQAALEDLLAYLPEDRHPPLRRQRRLLDETVAGSFALEAEQQAARHADRQGIGSGGGFSSDGEDVAGGDGQRVATPAVEATEPVVAPSPADTEKAPP
ncbi:DUF2254 domain-containing protein [Egicoccus sp. AB-alg2]|uniref:DUF2254 domain-containing protein n=1 Tax=Egicoccus sp. AB-alg2 TaxID=3242693 RepID=UPI00359E7118